MANASWKHLFHVDMFANLMYVVKTSKKNKNNSFSRICLWASRRKERKNWGAETKLLTQNEDAWWNKTVRGNWNSSRALVDNIRPRAKTIICNQICTRPCLCPPSNSPHRMDSLCILDGSRENGLCLMPPNGSDRGADNGWCRWYLKTEPVFTCQLENSNKAAKV